MSEAIHEERHLQSSDFLTDIVIGMSDGLTVPFALAAGLSAVASSPGIIITAGIAEIVAGSIAMGLGGYLAGRTELDHYNSELKKEYEEVETVPDKEKQEVRDILGNLGLSKEIQQQAAEEMAQSKKLWVDFMMKYELGLDKPNPKRARNSALNIGLSYVVGGLVPLSPYFFVDHPTTGLQYSSLVTALCLFVFGYFKASVTGQNLIKGALRVLIIGGLAATAAFFVARLFV